MRATNVDAQPRRALAGKLVKEGEGEAERGPPFRGTRIAGGDQPSADAQLPSLKTSAITVAPRKNASRSSSLATA